MRTTHMHSMHMHMLVDAVRMRYSTCSASRPKVTPSRLLHRPARSSGQSGDSAKFDMSLHASELAQAIRGAVTYCADLFESSTASAIGHAVTELVSGDLLSRSSMLGEPIFSVVLPISALRRCGTPRKAKMRFISQNGSLERSL